MDSFHAYLEAVSVSVEALKFGQITSVVLIVLISQAFVYMILHRVNVCED